MRRAWVPIEPRRRQRQAPGLSRTDALDHKPGAICANLTPRLVWHSELRLVIRQGNIADAGQPQTAAQHRAVQHGDHHLRRVLHLLQQRAECAVQIAKALAP